MMVRAALILGGLGVLAAMEFATPSRSQKSVQDLVQESIASPASTQATTEAGSRDTLTKADRFAMSQLLSPSPFVPSPQPASLVEQTPPPGEPQQTSPGSELHGRGPGAAVLLPRPRPKQTGSGRAEPKVLEARHTEPKHVEPKTAAKPDRAKALAEAKACQANAFAGLLKALNLPGGCDT
jgi:hypothetical protein